MPPALEQFMIVVTGMVGDLTELIANAFVTFGQHVQASSSPLSPTYSMDLLATGLFSSTVDDYGLIYFVNEKIMWLLAEINAVPVWDGFKAFLMALADAGLI